VTALRDVHRLVAEEEATLKSGHRFPDSTSVKCILEDWHALEAVFRVLVTQKQAMSLDQRHAVDSVLRLRGLR
jgi:hypothetical protein